jgi:hypothetical protein
MILYFIMLLETVDSLFRQYEIVVLTQSHTGFRRMEGMMKLIVFMV